LLRSLGFCLPLGYAVKAGGYTYSFNPMQSKLVNIELTLCIQLHPINPLFKAPVNRDGMFSNPYLHHTYKNGYQIYILKDNSRI
jgi:hypothetical protein